MDRLLLGATESEFFFEDKVTNRVSIEIPETGEQHPGDARETGAPIRCGSYCAIVGVADRERDLFFFLTLRFADAAMYVGLVLPFGYMVRLKLQI